jgi:hypothetical protein
LPEFPTFEVEDRPSLFSISKFGKDWFKILENYSVGKNALKIVALFYIHFSSIFDNSRLFYGVKMGSNLIKRHVSVFYGNNMNKSHSFDLSQFDHIPLDEFFNKTAPELVVLRV